MRSIRPLELHHVVDADSSQTVVIAEAAGGQLTGRQRTARHGQVADHHQHHRRRRCAREEVLFVAEKMAALDVVHRRLQPGRAWPADAGAAFEQGQQARRSRGAEAHARRPASRRAQRPDRYRRSLARASERAERLRGRLHEPLEPSGLSPQAILGVLARAQESSVPGGFALTGAEGWDRSGCARLAALVDDVAGTRFALLGRSRASLAGRALCAPRSGRTRGASGERVAATGRRANAGRRVRKRWRRMPWRAVIHGRSADLH